MSFPRTQAELVHERCQNGDEREQNRAFWNSRDDADERLHDPTGRQIVVAFEVCDEWQVTEILEATPSTRDPGGWEILTFGNREWTVVSDGIVFDDDGNEVGYLD